MRHFWWTDGMAMAIAAGELLLVGWSLYWSTRVYTDPRPAAVDAVRRKVEAALPPGSSREDVKSWLAAEELPASEVIYEDSRRFAILAGKRLPSDNWLGFYDCLELEFSFDSDGNLEREFVRIVSIGS
jgi:hypothetical protein